MYLLIFFTIVAVLTNFYFLFTENTTEMNRPKVMTQCILAELYRRFYTSRRRVLEEKLLTVSIMEIRLELFCVYLHTCGLMKELTL